MHQGGRSACGRPRSASAVGQQPVTTNGNDSRMDAWAGAARNLVESCHAAYCRGVDGPARTYSLHPPAGVRPSQPTERTFLQDLLFRRWCNFTLYAAPFSESDNVSPFCFIIVITGMHRRHQSAKRRDTLIFRSEVLRSD